MLKLRHVLDNVCVSTTTCHNSHCIAVKIMCGHFFMFVHFHFVCQASSLLSFYFIIRFEFGFDFPLTQMSFKCQLMRHDARYPLNNPIRCATAWWSHSHAFSHLTCDVVPSLFDYHRRAMATMTMATIKSTTRSSDRFMLFTTAWYKRAAVAQWNECCRHWVARPGIWRTSRRRTQSLLHSPSPSPDVDNALNTGTQLTFTLLTTNCQLTTHFVRGAAWCRGK